MTRTTNTYSVKMRRLSLERFDGVTTPAFFKYCIHKFVGSAVLITMMKVSMWALTPVLTFVVSMVA